MSARFEVVRTDAAQPWHARFVAGNGRIVWTTETYTRRAGAFGAIALMTGYPVTPWRDTWEVPFQGGVGLVEVRLVDERAVPDDVSPEGPL